VCYAGSHFKDVDWRGRMTLFFFRANQGQWVFRVDDMNHQIFGINSYGIIKGKSHNKLPVLVEIKIVNF